MNKYFKIQFRNNEEAWKDGNGDFYPSKKKAEEVAETWRAGYNSNPEGCDWLDEDEIRIVPEETAQHGEAEGHIFSLLHDFKILQHFCSHLAKQLDPAKPIEDHHAYKDAEDTRKSAQEYLDTPQPKN